MNSNLIFLVWLEPGQGDPVQPTIIQRGWKTLVISRKKWPGQRGNHHGGWCLALGTTSARSSDARPPRGQGWSCGRDTMMAAHGLYWKTKKIEIRKRENNKRMIECEKTWYKIKHQEKGQYHHVQISLATMELINETND